MLTVMDVFLFRDLDRLKQTGNFSRAAELAHLSQPAFSRRIKSLEAWVGATLVDRSRQPVRLTEAGDQMLQAGLEALSGLELRREHILETQRQPKDTIITFGAQHSIGWRFYPMWLQALEEAYGPIPTRLRADDLPSCLEDLENGDVDFVIAFERTDTHTHKSYDSIPIGADQLIPVCQPKADGTPLYRFDDPTQPTPHLHFGDAAPLGALLEPLLTANTLQQRLKLTYENTMVGALRNRARGGDGVAWLPKSLVQPDLDAQLLVQTGRSDWIVELTVRLFRNTKHANATSRALWTWLTQNQV